MSVLVTGGAGYIGSHMALALLELGEDVVVLDNLVTGVRALVPPAAVFVQGAVSDRTLVAQLIRDHRVDAVVHFGGSTVVPESVVHPLKYSVNNTAASRDLLDACLGAGIRRFIFSSTAAVYGDVKEALVDEDTAQSPANPYGRPKLMTEWMLRDLSAASTLQYVALRYFNPVGAHPGGTIGEDPIGEPQNLVPYVSQVAVGRRPVLRIFGDDYPTPDGTGIRDYIHVMDLAEGHVAALDGLVRDTAPFAVNLGTGRGCSVREVVAAFERACGRTVPCLVVPRRPGDSAVSYADPTLARDALGWQARRGLDAMCEDAWRWQSSNPAGYRADGKPS